MATGRKKVATVISVQIEVSNFSITDEICMNLDSHADTCVLGKDYLKLYNCNRPVTVSVWNPKDGERLCQKISGAVDYNHPQSGQVYIFMFHQCIHVEHLYHHLLCPMQCQMNGADANETP